MKLFVDCDDTLVIYEDSGSEIAKLLRSKCLKPIHPYGVNEGVPYVVNVDLVKYIHRFKETYPNALIVVWSGGGKNYAILIARICGLESIADICMIKDRTTYPLVSEGDIVVDDQSIEVPAVVTPPNFFGLTKERSIDCSSNNLDHSGDNCKHHVCLRGPRGESGSPGSL